MGLTTMLASLACGPATGKGLNCRDTSNYTFSGQFWIDIWKRRADITYNLGNRSIELVDNLSPAYGSEFINPTAYLDFYDRIFPPLGLRSRPEEPYGTTLETIVFDYCQLNSMASPNGQITFGYMETLMLPWLLQQFVLQMLTVKDLTLDNIS